jgi:hypothetical protein
MTWGYVAVAGAAVVGGYLASESQKEAAGTAAEAQTEASQAAIAEQRTQFQALQENLAPYMEGGPTALTQQQALIGLGGPEAQQQAISAIEASPQFGAMVQQGEEAILQNAAATGGLRGGNTQAALAQFRPQVLSNLIESQYSKLGEVARLGQASAAGVGAAGTQAAGNIGAFQQQAGLAQGQAALAGGQAQAQLYGDIAGAVGQAYGSGAFNQQNQSFNQQNQPYTANTAGQPQAGGLLGPR